MDHLYCAFVQVATSKAIRELTVPPGNSIRLDQFLIMQQVESSRRRARELLASGAVRVNGRLPRKGQPLRTGDVVTIVLATRGAAELSAEPMLPVEVLHADGDVIALNKPSGMPSTARRITDRGTVANFLSARFPELRKVGNTLESGLVHRLDTETSGILIAGRTTSAYARLRRQFRSNVVDKDYLALVAGRLDRPGLITQSIAHMPRRPRRMCVCVNRAKARALGARPAETAFRPLRVAVGATLIAVNIRTGVRHQVRVHLASIGHPVLGDRLYADGLPVDVAAPRLLLHAWRLSFTHPKDGAHLRLQASIPADFRGVLSRLSWQEPKPKEWDQF